MKAERLAEIKSFNPKPTDLVDWAKLQTAVLEYLPESVAEVERLQNKLALYALGKRNLNAMVEHKDAEIARLRKALEYFADDENYFYGIAGECAVLDNGRKLAREALG